jgi:hypothetical protein
MSAILAPQGATASTNVIPLRTWRHMLATRLARLSGKQIGEACNCDHTQASRIASGQRGATIEEWCNLIELMGLKLVDADKVCISPDRLRFLEQTTARALANEDVAKALWESPE